MHILSDIDPRIRTRGSLDRKAIAVDHNTMCRNNAGALPRLTISRIRRSLENAKEFLDAWRSQRSTCQTHWEIFLPLPSSLTIKMIVKNEMCHLSHLTPCSIHHVSSLREKERWEKCKGEYYIIRINALVHVRIFTNNINERTENSRIERRNFFIYSMLREWKSSLPFKLKRINVPRIPALTIAYNITRHFTKA